MRKTLAAGGSLAMIALLAACSGGGVPADDAAEQTEIQLEEQVGERPEVTCSEDLPAEEGATIECELTAESIPDDTYAVTLTVTSVDGSDVAFDIQVADEPMA